MAPSHTINQPSNEPSKTFLYRLDARLSTSPYWIVCVLAWVIVAVKSGVLARDSPVYLLASCPYPEDRLTGTSYGLRLIAWILRTESVTAYLVISIVLVAITMVVMPWALRRRMSSLDARAAILLVTSGSIGTILLGNIGRTDVLVLLGAALVGILGSRFRWTISGILIMLLGNPEQALVSSVIYCICCFTPKLRSRIRPALAGLLVAMAGTAVITVWTQVYGASGRVDYLGQFLGNSFYHFGRSWPLSLYAAYGVLWVVITFAIWTNVRWHRFLLISTGVLIPICVTAITLDQTRVFVGVSAATAFALVTTHVHDIRTQLTRLKLPVLVVTLGAVLLMPSIEIDYRGTLRPSYEWVFVWVSGK